MASLGSKWARMTDKADKPGEPDTGVADSRTSETPDAPLARDNRESVRYGLGEDPVVVAGSSLRYSSKPSNWT